MDVNDAAIVVHYVFWPITKHSPSTGMRDFLKALQLLLVVLTCALTDWLCTCHVVRVRFFEPEALHPASAPFRPSGSLNQG